MPVPVGYVPSLSVSIEYPSRPEDWAGTTGLRRHNSASKEAMREVLRTHHAKRIPEHFRKSAHQKYEYARRDEKYMHYKAKRYHSTTDLVRTGDSRDKMLANPKIVVSGAAEGGKKEMEGHLIMRFAFRGGSGRFRLVTSRQHVTVEQMVSEMKRMTDQERTEIAIQFNNAYWRRYYVWRGSRKRIRGPNR